MSQELERVYTIPLGKVKLSQSQHRAVRAINMIREFAQHHMKVETIKIEEELAHEVWAKGVRNPPRKVRVRMSKTEEGHILVSRYDEDAEPKATPEKETKKVSDKVEEPAKEEPAKEEPAKEEPAKEEPEEPAKEEPAKEEPAKEEPAKEEPAKEEPAKEEPAKEEPTKEEPTKEESKKE
jgi:large subunit ribosomal protein L31e